MALPNNIFQSLVLSVVLGVAFYLIAVVATDLQNVWAATIRLGFFGWLVVLGLSLLNYALRFMRWHRYLVYLGHHIPPGRHLAYYLAGFGFTTTPGKAGEMVRSLYLKRHQVNYSHSLAAFFTERYADMVAMILLALAAAFAFENARLPVAFLGVLIILLLPLIHSRRLQQFLENMWAGVSSSRIKALIGNFMVLLQSSSTLLVSGPLYGGMALGLLAWGAEGYGFYLILEYLGVHTSIIMAAGIYAVSVIIGALSFIPGGLGSTEASMFLLLGSIGADPPTAVAATMICRVATLWFAVAIGLLAIGGLAISGNRISSRKVPDIKSNV